MQDNMNNASNKKPVKPQMGNSQPNRGPVRPQMDNQQSNKPVRPQMGGQQSNRPVRPQMNNDQHIQQNTNTQNSGRPQVQNQAHQSLDNTDNIVMNELQNGYESPANNDIDFEEFNSNIVNDTVAENKARGRKEKKAKVKKQLTPEQKKIKTKELIIAAVGIIIIIACASIAIKILKKGSQHINVANTTQTHDTSNETQNNDSDDNTNQEVSNVTDEIQQQMEETSTSSIEAKESSESSPLNINEYTYMDTVVNTKTAEDTTYTDRDAKVYARLSNFVSGYNEVSKYIAEYNETNTQNKNIMMPDSTEYYTQSNGTEIVMFEFELLYPSDYPTSASEGRVYKIPILNMELLGTVKDIENDDITEDPSHYIVVDDTIYNVSKITDISVYNMDVDKGLEINKPIKLRYVTALPVGASDSVYVLKLNLDLDKDDLGKDSATFWFKGQTVEASEELKAIEAELSQYIEKNTDEETNTDEKTSKKAEDKTEEEQGMSDTNIDNSTE